MDKKTFLKWANSRWAMWYFLMKRLPAAWFMGIYIHSVDGQSAQVALPYGWRSQNPFRSIYFAAQCAAAELSTGVLAMAALSEGAPVSMLVTAIEAEFLKKAADTLVFECIQGVEVAEVVEETRQSGEAIVLTMTSIGRLPDGAVAAKVEITWSFKRKS
jgi:predicted lipoprotein